MPLIIGLVILFVIVILAIVLTLNVIGVLITLVVAGLVGWLADAIVPGDIPLGWLGAIIAGLVGSWIGTALFGSFGPSIAGIPIIPAIVGAIIFAFVVSLLSRAFTPRSA